MDLTKDPKWREMKREAIEKNQAILFGAMTAYEHTKDPSALLNGMKMLQIEADHYREEAARLTHLKGATEKW